MLSFVLKVLTEFVSPQAAMCYVHVAALVAEYLHRKSKFKLKHKTFEELTGSWNSTPNCAGLIKAVFVLLHNLQVPRNSVRFQAQEQNRFWPGHLMFLEHKSPEGSL